jgi:hypothetical protein
VSLRSVLVLLALAGACGVVAAGLGRGTSAGFDEADIRARLSAYAKVPLPVDLAALPPSEREALAALVRAVEAVDGIYWKQMGPQALEAKAAVAAGAGGKEQEAVVALYRDFVAINYGPFDIRRDMERFLDTPTGGARLRGVGFYPSDLTKEELERHLARHPALRAEFERTDTAIRRVDGALVAIPYQRLYLDELEAASEALKKAAALVGSPSLRRALSLRAEALLSGDTYASDLAWLDVKDNALDVVIGPIETYDDRLLGLKASYEGAALVKDARGTRALEVYLKNFDALAAALPVEERYRKATAGKGNVLEIVNVVRFGGDFNAGIKTVAASLPNDERVIEARGAKKQIYRNVLEAKFDAILQPIAATLLAKKGPSVSREAFVTNVLLHELSHTLGLDYVAGSRDRTVRRALKERYAAIEEAKADVVGLFNLSTLRTLEVFADEEVQECDATYLAGLFRSVRFGTEEAHGRGNAVQVGFLMEQGALVLDPKKGEFSVHPKKFEPAIAALAKELLEIEGTGDYDRAGRLLDRYGTLAPEVTKALGAIQTVPVDVVFTYPM